VGCRGRYRLALVAGLLVAAGCTPAPSGSSRPSDGGAGAVVTVLYAASLLRPMEQQLAPRFAAATGYRLEGIPGGSDELAHDIETGIRSGDVFLSASPQVDVALEATAGGHRWVSWYVDIARAPLVLGYDPHSRFASDLRRRPWFEVVTSPGFLLGRTDPVLDPKGALAVEALSQAAARTGERGLLAIAASSAGVFPEEALLGRLETGQLDAAFLYEDEARAAGIPTVSLSPVALGATFTVTVLAGAPHRAGALAFVRFLLGPTGRRILGDAGFAVLDPPVLHGTGAPQPIATSLGRS